MSKATVSNNFGTNRNYTEPGEWADWSYNGESILLAFRQKSRFKGSKTKMFVKLVRFFKVKVW